MRLGISTAITQPVPRLVSVLPPPGTLWGAWDARSGTFDGDGVCAALADLTGNARPLAQDAVGSSPIRTLNALNGKPIITFDGIDDWLETPEDANPQGFAAVFVINQVTWTANDRILSTVSGSNPIWYQTAGGGGTSGEAMLLFAGSGFQPFLDLPTEEWAIITARFDGTSSRLRKNLEAAAEGEPGTTAGNGVILGANQAGANSWSNIAIAAGCIIPSTNTTKEELVINFYNGLFAIF